jgi:7-carboxy-7-deazaguanine synthase
MAQIKVSELFYSIQGEGRYMGVPSVFLRTFGCNFTCSGFGMPKNHTSTERDDIAAKAESFTDYKSLPLVTTGCDSYASWDPRFKHLSPVLSTDSIADSIVSILPHNGWQDEHLVITGGEPLLGWQRSYPDLLNHPKMKSLKELTFETNGTQPLSKDLRQYLLDWSLNPNHTSKGRRGHDSITFSVSAKLSNSGEKREEAILPDVVASYEEVGYTYLKFVVSNFDDMEEVQKVVPMYRNAGFKGPVYVMPVGGVENVYKLNNRRVADMAMKNGWRYSDRLQVPLFKNEWGT